MDSEYFRVIEGMTTYIANYLQRAASEQSQPSANADSSDESIKENIYRANRMRRLREDFERIVTGVIDDAGIK